MDTTGISDDVLENLDDDIVERTPSDDLNEIIQTAIETTEHELVDRLGIEPGKEGRGTTRSDDEDEVS